MCQLQRVSQGCERQLSDRKEGLHVLDMPILMNGKEHRVPQYLQERTSNVSYITLTRHQSEVVKISGY